ncbi:transposase [bacterium]|nr:transposase [bacterium]
MPAQPIEKGLPGPGLLAHVLVSKYCDHLPLHRQEAIMQRYGIELSRGDHERLGEGRRAVAPAAV